MKSRDSTVRVEARSATFAAVAVVLVSGFQALFYLAPAFLAKPLWEGGTLTVSFLLGTLSVAVPVAVGWLIIRADKTGGDTFDIARH
jgi:hypothetical protein